VIKGNRVTGDEEEVPSRLQMVPRFLVDKFKWNQRLPIVDGMEQLSPASVHDNTAFVDEQPTPSLRNCTSVKLEILITYSSHFLHHMRNPRNCDLLLVSELTKETHFRKISKHHQPVAIAQTSSIRATPNSNGRQPKQKKNRLKTTMLPAKNV
jgi:hypothetical protein